MFVVALSFATGPGTQRMIRDEVDALQHGVGWALQFPTCTVTIMRDGQVHLRIQQAAESGGRPLAPDLIAFLRSRLTTT